MKEYRYMNIETGELVTRSEMLEQLEEMYDFDEATPISEMWNYFERI